MKKNHKSACNEKAKIAAELKYASFNDAIESAQRSAGDAEEKCSQSEEARSEYIKAQDNLRIILNHAATSKNDTYLEVYNDLMMRS